MMKLWIYTKYTDYILIKKTRTLYLLICYVSVKSKLQHAPAPGIPRPFDTFAVPGRREFDCQSLPGGGEFDPHDLGVGNLNCTLDFMWNLWRGELCGTRCSWKRLCLCGQLVTRKGLTQDLWRIWRIQILKFLILDSGFECVNVFYCCVYSEIQYLYRRFNTTT